MQIPETTPSATEPFAQFQPGSLSCCWVKNPSQKYFPGGVRCDFGACDNYASYRDVSPDGRILFAPEIPGIPEEVDPSSCRKCSRMFQPYDLTLSLNTTSILLGIGGIILLLGLIYYFFSLSRK